MKTSYYTDNRLSEQKVKIFEKYYKEEIQLTLLRNIKPYIKEISSKLKKEISKI